MFLEAPKILPANERIRGEGEMEQERGINSMWDLKDCGLEGASTGDLPNADSTLHDTPLDVNELEKSEWISEFSVTGSQLAHSIIYKF